MIVLDLCCEHDHRFEGWFASSEAFEMQQQAGQISCPVCDSIQIRRLPSAPYVQTRSAAPARLPAELPPQGKPAEEPTLPADAGAILAQAIAALRRMGKEAEDVGARFPEEARKIHYGESEARSIRGAASARELGELLDEGIMALPLPPAEEDLH